MRIDTLQLENFRCFEKLTLDLHPRLTVLAGVNGSGKSSVLEGLAIATGGWFLALKGVKAPRIEVSQVRLKHVDHGDDHHTIEPQYPTTVRVAQGELGPLTRWARSRETADGDEDLPTAGGLIALGAKTRKRIAAGDPIGLPVVAGYWTDRLWRAEHDGELGSRLDGYLDAFKLRAQGRQFKAWMRRLEQAYLQRLDKAIKAKQPFGLIQRSPLLLALQRAVSTLMPDAQRLYFDVAEDRLMLEAADERRMPFDRLSDGYRTIIALAADIAWRAIQLNPHHGADAIERSEGVVLIDEIELHLHPRWQRTVLPDLMRIFPKIQFVVTTHSPVIISSVAAEHLRFLDADGTVQRPGRGKGLTANAVLRTLMGVPERDAETQAALNALAVQIENGAAAEARLAYDALYALLGEDDSELRVLGWELDELETFGAAD